MVFAFNSHVFAKINSIFFQVPSSYIVDVGWGEESKHFRPISIKKLCGISNNEKN